MAQKNERFHIKLSSLWEDKRAVDRKIWSGNEMSHLLKRLFKMAAMQSGGLGPGFSDVPRCRPSSQVWHCFSTTDEGAVLILERLNIQNYGGTKPASCVNSSKNHVLISLFLK